MTSGTDVEIIPQQSIQNRRTRAKELVESLSGLPYFPTILSKVLEGIADDKTRASEVAHTIEMDAYLAQRILKVVNSPAIGLGTRVTTIQHAIALLGLDQIKQECLKLTTAEFFRDLDGVSYFGKRKTLYLHLLAVATAGENLARITGWCTAEQAFTAGFAHDLGILIIDRLPGRALTDLRMLLERGGHALNSVELAVLGCDHTDVGYVFGENQKMDPNLLKTIAYHHTPEGLSENDEGMGLVRTIWLADHVAELCGFGSEAPEEFDWGAALDRFNISDEDMRECLQSIPARLQTFAQLLTHHFTLKEVEKINTVARADYVRLLFNSRMLGARTTPGAQDYGSQGRSARVRFLEDKLAQAWNQIELLRSQLQEVRGQLTTYDERERKPVLEAELAPPVPPTPIEDRTEVNSLMEQLGQLVLLWDKALHKYFSERQQFHEVEAKFAKGLEQIKDHLTALREEP